MSAQKIVNAHIRQFEAETRAKAKRLGISGGTADVRKRLMSE